MEPFSVLSKAILPGQTLCDVDCKNKLWSVYLCAISFSLFFATPLLELHASHVHDGGCDLVDVILLFLGETQNVESLLHHTTKQRKYKFKNLPTTLCQYIFDSMNIDWYNFKSAYLLQFLFCINRTYIFKLNNHKLIQLCEKC